MLREPINNEDLLRCLEAIKPDDLSMNRWLKQAGLNSSFFTSLRNGREPGVYKIERLVAVTGIRMSVFWKRVETARRS